MSTVPDIKLIRTDTTLDLSQKAEKGMLFWSLLRVYVLRNPMVNYGSLSWGNGIYVIHVIYFSELNRSAQSNCAIPARIVDE